MLLDTVHLIKSEADRVSHPLVSLKVKTLVKRLSCLRYLSDTRVCDAQSIQGLRVSGVFLEGLARILDRKVELGELEMAVGKVHKHHGLNLTDELHSLLTSCHCRLFLILEKVLKVTQCLIVVCYSGLVVSFLHA